MKIIVGKKLSYAVPLNIPMGEHILEIQKLLERAKCNFLRRFRRGCVGLDGLKNLTMYKELKWVEHFPPVCVSVVRYTSIVHVSHEPVRQLAGGPKTTEVGRVAGIPFFERFIGTPFVRSGGEETTTIRLPVYCSRWAVTLNNVSRLWPGFACRSNRREHVVW